MYVKHRFDIHVLRLTLQAGVFEAVGLGAEHGFWISFKDRMNPEDLVNQVTMIHVVVVPNHCAEAVATTPDDTITFPTPKCH